MESVWSVSKLSTESVDSRRELVANCVHTADATKQFRRVGVGGVYWASGSKGAILRNERRETYHNITLVELAAKDVQFYCSFTQPPMRR